jgi:hypothetical protein
VIYALWLLTWGPGPQPPTTPQLLNLLDSGAVAIMVSDPNDPRFKEGALLRRLLLPPRR